MRQYGKEFRKQALKLSDEVGVKKAAEQLGIIYGTLADWRKLRKKKNKVSTESDITPLTERELQMHKEILELKEANEILKDALGFFAKDRKK